MSEPLVIWLPENLEDPWAYYQSADQQGWASDASERKELAAIDNGQAVFVCPGTWMRVFAHSLPDMKSSERLSAAGFFIEEKLAGSLNEQHIVLGAGDDQRIGVMGQTQIENLLAEFDQLGLTPSKLVAEYEVFSAGDDVMTVWHRSIQPGPMGYSLDAEEEGDNPLSFVPQMKLDGALNYAQGRFQRRQKTMPVMQSLTRLAALLAVSGLVWLGWQASQTRAMNQQTAELKTQAATLYTDATGKAAPNNPALAVTREVRSGGNPAVDFLSLSAHFFDGIKQVDGILIETIRYNDNKNQLNVKLIYPSFDSASQLEQIFSSGSGQFVSGAVREQNDTLIGEGVFTLGGGA